MSYELHQAREDSLAGSGNVANYNDSLFGGSVSYETISADIPGDNVNEPVFMQTQQPPCPWLRDEMIMDKSSVSNWQPGTSSHDLVSTYEVPSTTIPFPPTLQAPRMGSSKDEYSIAYKRKGARSASISRLRKRRSPPVILPAYPGLSLIHISEPTRPY